MKNPNVAPIRPSSFRWGNWLIPPDPTGNLKNFLVSALILLALVVVGMIFQDSIFIAVPPSRAGADAGWPPWFFLILAVGVTVTVIGGSLGSNGLRIDRVEFNSTGMMLTYSHIPTVLAPYEITSVRFGWDAVGCIVQYHPDDGESGPSYSIKVKLSVPLKTGDKEFDLSMLDEKEMHRALRKIRVLQG
jgi:hypothetical protein